MVLCASALLLGPGFPLGVAPPSLAGPSTCSFSSSELEYCLIQVVPEHLGLCLSFSLERRLLVLGSAIGVSPPGWQEAGRSFFRHSNRGLHQEPPLACPL